VISASGQPRPNGTDRVADELGLLRIGDDRYRHFPHPEQAQHVELAGHEVIGGALARIVEL